MSRTGFVQAVKARGKYYFYVRISFRDENKKPKNKNLMGLGQKEKAHLLLQSWIDDKNSIPEVMKKYNQEDFKKWLKYVQDK